MNHFKALAFNKKIYEPKNTQRYSAPPKMTITQPKAFNLSTDRRGKMSRSKIEIKENANKQFKARAMPSYPKPSSPVKSTVSIDFKEFNLSRGNLGRKSCPPLMNNKGFKIKARDMPNFSRIVPKQIESNRELTVPQGFELAGERLHREAQQLKREKLELQ